MPFVQRNFCRYQISQSSPSSICYIWFVNLSANQCYNGLGISVSYSDYPKRESVGIRISNYPDFLVFYVVFTYSFRALDSSVAFSPKPHQPRPRTPVEDQIWSWSQGSRQEICQHFSTSLEEQGRLRWGALELESTHLEPEIRGEHLWTLVCMLVLRISEPAVGFSVKLSVEGAWYVCAMRVFILGQTWAWQSEPGENTNNQSDHQTVVVSRFPPEQYASRFWHLLFYSTAAQKKNTVLYSKQTAVSFSNLLTVQRTTPGLCRLITSLLKGHQSLPKSGL